MVVVDNSIFRFKGSELLVMLYLLTHANEMGVCYTSYSLLAHDLDLSVQNCRTIINRLKTLNEINTTSTNKITQVTILNYASYTLNANSHQQAEIDRLTAKISDLEEQLRKAKSPKSLPQVKEDREKRLEARAKNFGKTLIPFLDEKGGLYPKDMIRAFYDYWTEPNKTRTKMRFEMEKTWEVSRRLTTWANNNKSKYNFKSRDEQRIDEIQQRQDRAAAIIARLAEEEESLPQ